MKLEDAVRIAQAKNKSFIRPNMYGTGIYFMLDPEFPRLSPIYLIDLNNKDEDGELKKHLYNPTVEDVLADDWVVI